MISSVIAKVVVALLVSGSVIFGVGYALDSIGKNDAYKRELKTKDAALADERNLRETQAAQNAQYAASLADAQAQISALQSRIDAQRAALPKPVANQEIPACPALCRLPDYSPQS